MDRLDLGDFATDAAELVRNAWADRNDVDWLMSCDDVSALEQMLYDFFAERM